MLIAIGGGLGEVRIMSIGGARLRIVRYLEFLLLFCVVCDASSQELERLAASYFESRNTTVAVSFEYRPSGPTMARGGNYYYAQAGDRFLQANGGDAPILSPRDFPLARELAGFDGEHYWELRLDGPHSLSVDGPDGPSVEVFNALTLVPKEEAVLGPRFPGDPAYLVLHLRYTQLGRKVARFGFDSYQYGPPEYKSVPRPTYVSEDRIAKIQGPPRRPDALVFEPVFSAQVMLDFSSSQKLTYDYGSDTIDLFVGKADAWKNEATIRLIGVEYPAAIADATFSWRNYEAIAGQKIAVIQTQHEVLQAQITPDGVQTGAVITAIAQPDPPTPDSKRSFWFVPTLIVLAAAGAVFLAKYAHDAAPRNKAKRE